jgi:amphi-Trp domain-containing protein
MSEFERDDHVSRQQAAERLTDIAYALTAAGRLKLDGDQEISVPAVDEIVMKRAGRSNRDRVEIELTLSWSTRSLSGVRDGRG